MLKKRSEYCWSKAEKDALVKMVEKGFGWQDIAAQIGRTRAACNAMYHLLIKKNRNGIAK